MSKRRRDPRSDDGTIMLLTLGFTVLALLLVMVITAATQVHLQRMQLTHVADELALDAADAMDLNDYYAGHVDPPGEHSVIPLSRDAVAAIAQQRVDAAAERAGLPSTLLLSAVTTDGHSATVTVQTVVHPLFGVDALLPFADGVTLTTTSSARAY